MLRFHETVFVMQAHGWCRAGRSRAVHCVEALERASVNLGMVPWEHHVSRVSRVCQGCVKGVKGCQGVSRVSRVSRAQANLKRCSLAGLSGVAMHAHPSGALANMFRACGRAVHADLAWWPWVSWHRLPVALYTDELVHQCSFCSGQHQSGGKLTCNVECSPCVGVYPPECGACKMSCGLQLRLVPRLWCGAGGCGGGRFACCILRLLGKKLEFLL